MVPDIGELFWAVAGNLVVGFGAGTATLAAFAPTLPAVPGSNPAIRVGVVSVGFAFFFAGYRLSQTGTYRDTDESLLAAFTPDSGGVGSSGETGRDATPASDAGEIDAFLVLRGIFLLLGVVGLGAGMRLFALTIQGWDATLGVATGLVCIGGYICGHIGMNGVLL